MPRHPKIPIFILCIIAIRLCPGASLGGVLTNVAHTVFPVGFSGEGCVEMHLRSLGSAYRAADVFRESGLDPALGRGVDVEKLAKALPRLGYSLPDSVLRVGRRKLGAFLAQQWAKMDADLAAGTPWLVRLAPDVENHVLGFVVVVGLDTNQQAVVYHDPIRADGAFQSISVADFEKRWVFKAGFRRYSVFGIPMRNNVSAPHTIATSRRTVTRMDCAVHVRALVPRLPGSAFDIDVAPPFVIISDQSHRRIKQQMRDVVRPALQQWRTQFFANDPDHVVEVWLFRDAKSYMKHIPDLFGHEPASHLGYMSPEHNALIVNMASGVGALRHELVHPFVRANIATCPTWFDEGMASLYERCDERGDVLRGLPNWRLILLQKAIKEHETLPLEQLFALEALPFYNDPLGVHYAQSRYLFLYLQERELLQAFYAAFESADPSERSSERILLATVDGDDLQTFQRHWEAYVMALRFP
ncbi:MAG: hypothetical protein OSB41_04310 [Kiritimatiellae bacterium]|nr:hypothetical protein [Kiritimatiellia bacterium]